jgi:hypothetical protein
MSVPAGKMTPSEQEIQMTDHDANPAHDEEPVPNENTPLGRAKDWLRLRLREGRACPLCLQHAQMYRRTINSGMARSLVRMYQVGGLGWQHVPTTMGRASAEEGKLAYWGLIEEERTLRTDGGRAGWWRVTPKGRDFILLSTRLPKYALVYNGKVFGHEGDEITLRTAVGTKFNLDELLHARAS